MVLCRLVKLLVLMKMFYRLREYKMVWITWLVLLTRERRNSWLAVSQQSRLVIESG